MQVRQFGLLLALLVIVNYLLAITWLPVSTVCWERYLGCCSAISCDCCGDDGMTDDSGAFMSGPVPSINEAASLERPFSIPAGMMPAKDDPAPAPARIATPRDVQSAVLHGIPIQSDAEARSKPLSYLNSRSIWRKIFSLVFYGRFILILGLLAASVYGGFLASSLEPADSLPQLFEDSHNVQQFINLWSNNFTEDSLFACTSCLRLTATQDLNALGGGDPAAEATGSATGVEATAFFDTVSFSEDDLDIDRVNQNTIPVLVMWGVAGVTSAGEDRTDSFATSDADGIVLDDSFDLSLASTQRVIQQQVRPPTQHAFPALFCLPFRRFPLPGRPSRCTACLTPNSDVSVHCSAAADCHVMLSLQSLIVEPLCS